jgi:hypothetical protein
LRERISSGGGHGLQNHRTVAKAVDRFDSDTFPPEHFNSHLPRLKKPGDIQVTQGAKSAISAKPAMLQSKQVVEAKGPKRPPTPTSFRHY